MRVAAVIPARGGSKGIPRKNLLRLGGVPLVARPIIEAKLAKLDAVYVSTEDDQIAYVARAFGATVIDRPPELAGDNATSEAAVLHALGAMDERPDIVVMLQCTSPFLTMGDILGVVDLVREGRASAMTVAPFHGFIWTYSGPVNGGMALRQPRQAREVQFLETGGAYAMRTELFEASGNRFMAPIGYYLVPPARALEIDTIEDYQLAQRMEAAQCAT